MKLNPALYGRLSFMMFLNYFIWGAWYVTMSTYLLQTLEFSGTEVGIAYGAGAIAAMISPFFVGLVADRFFATERVLAVLHIIGAGLLYAVSVVDDFGAFYPFLLLYCICYFPTIALTNSVSFHAMGDDNAEFPWVRAWGTAGWIVVNLIIGFMAIEDSALTFQIAAGVSLFMGLYSFSLPHTPPKKKGQKVTAREAIGLDALGVLKDQSFLILFIASVLICIPLSFYYSFTNGFLNEVGFENAAGKMTLGQFSEFGFLLIMPFFFRRLGVKKMILLGMAAWALRYVLFAFGNVDSLVWMFYTGIVLHGICYDFFFVTGQIYADNKAPAHLRSSVQGLMTFATYGLGMFIGTYASGLVVDAYATEGGGHDWVSIWLMPAVFAVGVMLLFFFFFKDRSVDPVEAEAKAPVSELGTA
jgi:nucleoside transporter